MKPKKCYFSPEQKLKIAKEGLQKGVKVSELCRLYEIYPADFYRWKKHVEGAMKEGLKSTKKEPKLSKREEDCFMKINGFKK